MTLAIYCVIAAAIGFPAGYALGAVVDEAKRIMADALAIVSVFGMVWHLVDQVEEFLDEPSVKQLRLDWEDRP